MRSRTEENSNTTLKDNEMNNMLVKVGWNKDVVENNTSIDNEMNTMLVKVRLKKGVVEKNTSTQVRRDRQRYKQREEGCCREEHVNPGTTRSTTR